MNIIKENNEKIKRYLPHELKTRENAVKTYRNDSIKINQLNLNEDNKVTFKVESKENAKNKGGFNIFGKNFGDYNQDIEMSVKYEG